MSKRTLRRAAERKSRKLARVQNSISANAPAALQAEAAAPINACAISAPHEFPATCPNPASKLNLNSLLASAAGTSLTSCTPDAVEANAEVVHTATAAQFAANQANARKSTGPITPEGKAAVSQNRHAYGLSGSIFQLHAHESREDFELLRQSVYAEYAPETGTEQRLADDIIQHYWLTQRAIFYQQYLTEAAADSPFQLDEKRLGLFLRYQTTHERSYYKALRELQNLKKQKTRQEIGFESQKAKIEATEAKTRLANARARELELDTAVRQVMEAPLPGTTNIPFDELAKACSSAIARVAYQYQPGAGAE